MKIYLFLLLSLTLFSCNHYRIVRDYKYAPAPSCDCYIYGGGISVGSLNVYKYKRKAKCNKLNYVELRDSLSLQEVIKDSLEEQYYWDDYPDSTQRVTQEHINTNQKVIDSLRGEWVKCKIKLRYKEVYLYRKLATTTIKRKVTYYGLDGKLGKTKYLNDSIIKTTMPTKQ